MPALARIKAQYDVKKALARNYGVGWQVRVARRDPNLSWPGIVIHEATGTSEETAWEALEDLLRQIVGWETR